MKNKIKFLHGLGDRTQYKSLFKYFNVLDIDWNKGNLSKLRLGKQDVLIGFSLGCDIALMHAEKYKVKVLILCSMSPGTESLKNVKADKIIFMAGDKEKWLIKDIRRVLKTFKNKSEVVIVPEANHKIDKKYLKMLLEVIDSNT
jgi:alpha/beta superfamily hydrolase